VALSFIRDRLLISGRLMRLLVILEWIEGFLMEDIIFLFGD
jgi:hypothetical protein